MEINTNPNYLNNVQNQNAQGANSATAENVVEENLFDGNEANATQNNAVSQDYQNAEMLNTFIAAFTAVMAPFMQMMTQMMEIMSTNQLQSSEKIKTPIQPKTITKDSIKIPGQSTNTESQYNENKSEFGTLIVSTNFEAADLNNDNYVSEDEQNQTGYRFNGSDLDGDGLISLEEEAYSHENSVSKPGTKESKICTKDGSSIAHADSNFDGALSKEELESIGLNIKDFDTNNDGKVSTAEYLLNS